MMQLYHGSNVVVREPLVGIGRENLDFGLGFYVTALTTQADGWAANKARYYMQPEGYVSLYEFDFEAAVAAFLYHKLASPSSVATPDSLSEHSLSSRCSVSSRPTTTSGSTLSLPTETVATSGASGTSSRAEWPTTA